VATTAANELTRPARRSTRIERAIPVTITGVDAWRGPYVENVSTVIVSAHGCNYYTAHQVLNGALVMIELKCQQEESPRAARGWVRWVKRPEASGQLFQTAIEFEDPGNVWGLEDAPRDWLPWSGPKTIELDTSKAKPFAVPRAEPEALRAEEKNEKFLKTIEAQAIAPLDGGVTPVTQAVGGFQQQLEKMLSDAAAIAVRERSRGTFEELRATMREEVKRLITETMKTQANAAIQDSVQQLKTAARDITRAVQAQCSKQVESELQAVGDQIQSRRREMEEVSQALSLSALEKIEQAIDKLRGDSVDRIIARLKEQSAPLLSQTQKALIDLNKGTQEASGILSRSLEESTGRIREVHGELEKQFEKAIRDRLESAEAEFERAARGATIEALSDLRGLSQKHEAEVKTRLQGALEPILQESLGTLHQKATQVSQQFAGELEDYSRSHLEFVGAAISELAKGLRKKTKE